jgi:hypothetical protein
MLWSILCFTTALAILISFCDKIKCSSPSVEREVFRRYSPVRGFFTASKVIENFENVYRKFDHRTRIYLTHKMSKNIEFATAEYFLILVKFIANTDDKYLIFQYKEKISKLLKCFIEIFPRERRYSAERALLHRILMHLCLIEDDIYTMLTVSNRILMSERKLNIDYDILDNCKKNDFWIPTLGFDRDALVRFRKFINVRKSK